MTRGEVATVCVPRTLASVGDRDGDEVQITVLLDSFEEALPRLPAPGSQAMQQGQRKLKEKEEFLKQGLTPLSTRL
jgi:hypothetical protein